MNKFAVVLFLGYFLQTATVSAAEFTHLNKLFDEVAENYTNNTDFKSSFLMSLKTISEIDSSIKIYNSDTKAFLYINNTLTGLFDLPTPVQKPCDWKSVMTDILDMCVKYSPEIKLHKNRIETNILSTLTNGLDKYSRIEKISDTQQKITSDIRDGVLYIRISSFYPNVASEIRQIIQHSSQSAGLILDLRSNRGGSFNEAIKTADLFLEDVLITSSEDKQCRHYYTATSGDIFSNKPIVVLTDHTTASAAELLAAALSEQSRAVLVGTKTYGKSSIQNMRKLNGQTLFITSGHFFTPSGKSIDNNGLIPQICTGVNDSCTDKDVNNPDKDILIAAKLIKKNLS